MDLGNNTQFAAIKHYGASIPVILWHSVTSVGFTTLKLPTGTGLLVGALLLLYLAYWAIIPKPLASIPYNKSSAWSPLGDFPQMVEYILKEKELFVSPFPFRSSAGNTVHTKTALTYKKMLADLPCSDVQSWMGSLTEKYNSPIIQVFVHPFAKPWVVVTDPFETQDLLLRRSKDIDRSLFIGELLSGLTSEQHIQFRSDDIRFKRNRNLVNHLMVPSFINRVSGPEAYRCVNLLIQLWKAKCERAQGRPFSAIHDLSHSALDAIAGSLLGLTESESSTWTQLEAIHQAPLSKGNVDSKNVEDPITFPDAPIPSFLKSIITLTDSLMITQLSPFPKTTYAIVKMFPFLKNAIATKEAYITSKINKSLALMTSKEDPNQGDMTGSLPQNAIHSVLLRERQLAAKEGRQPNYHSRAITDEFVGFLIAGHDTTAVAMAWGVKYLSDHPSVQDRLRSELQAAMPAAFAQKRAPTYDEIVALQRSRHKCCEYLDAVIEEVLRLGNVIDFLLRETLRDTQILGRWIPKGTQLFLVANGPGYVRPSVEVEDAARSPGARKEGSESGKKKLSGRWDDGYLGEFKPERWLKINPETGSEEFDPLAGPTLAFGLGPRGCYGKRLGMMALRIHFVMIVWWFKLGRCPEELGGYEGLQKFAREPRRCFVRLEDAMGR